MRLSTKGRYAVTAMLDLAVNANEGRRITLADISEFQGISLSYLEQLFARLRKAKLVQGTRGPGGGYRLARSADSITIAEIIVSVDEKINMAARKPVINNQHTITQELWDELSQDIYEFLNDVTLGALVKRKMSRQSTNEITELKSDILPDIGYAQLHTPVNP